MIYPLVKNPKSLSTNFMKRQSSQFLVALSLTDLSAKIISSRDLISSVFTADTADIIPHWFACNPSRPHGK